MADYHIEYVITQVRVINVTASNQYDALLELNKRHELQQKHQELQDEFGLYKETIIITRVEEE